MNLDDAQSSSREQFDRQSSRYGRSHILSDTSDIDRAIAGLELPPPGPALDVATGGGHTAVYFERRGWSVTAADLAPGMLAQASRLAEEEGLTIATREHTAEELPYADASFGLVACRVAAHHFSDPARFVREVARVLVPGGIFLLIDGSVPDGEPEAEDWIHRVEKLRDPSHGRFLTPGRWTELAGAAGLEILVCRTEPFKQPDLEWYFETAATTPENRELVRELVRSAPPAAHRVFAIGEEDGKTIWWWPRLAFVARRAGM